MYRKTPEQISHNMKQVKNKDSQIEILLRKELWRRGLRYRKNHRKIYGNPDIVFINKRVAVFCDSEFWHGYDWEERKLDIKTNENFWIPKIERNIRRDKEVTEMLEKEGWIVLRFWGNDIKRDASSCADVIETTLRRQIVNAIQDN